MLFKESSFRKSTTETTPAVPKIVYGLEPTGCDKMVIPENSSSKTAFDIFVAVCVLYTAIAVPLEVAYQVRRA